MDEIPLREYIDALFAEKDRAVELAAEEREKAASALRTALERTIAEGDERLREHITNQIGQINAALTSADKLEVARIGAVQRELTAAQESAATAVSKQEAATERRFESVNEFRAQLATQTQSFMPREVADAQISEIRNKTEANADRLNSSSGESRGEEAARTRLYSALIVAAGIAAVVSPHIH